MTYIPRALELLLDAKGDLIGASADNTPARIGPVGANGTALVADSTATPGVAWSTTINGTAIPATKTLVVTTDKLSVHAATTSSELAGVISDETGSGALVFGTSPTISGASLAGSQATTTLGNNFSLTAGITLLRYTANTNATLTGISAAGATPADGRILFLMNVGTGTVTLSNASASSTAAYRFALPGATDVTMATGEGIALVYDGTSSVWRAAYPYSTAGNATAAAAVQTFLTTPSSANLISAVSDETGTGALVFANTPTLVTPVIGAATGTSLDLTGIALALNFQPDVTTLGTTGTINIDFAGAGFRTQAALTGNVTYTASNYAAGRSITIRVTNGTTLRTLTFPTSWKFLNSSKPANIAASKVGVLTVTSFGTTEADCVAAWSVEA